MLTALTIGLLGSLHCLGMCGPLVLAMPFRDAQGRWQAGWVAAYHGGRMFSYAALGLMMGLIGGGLRLFFVQQWISIASGVLLLAVYFLPRLIGPGRLPAFTSLWNRHVVAGMRRMLQPNEGQPQAAKLFSLGILNGLLPCGLVYMALIGAVAQPTIGQAALFMAIFGIGTSPALTGLLIARKTVFQKIRNSYTRVIPAFVVLVSALLILRGLGLGIPYLSPANEKNCCHRPEARVERSEERGEMREVRGQTVPTVAMLWRRLGSDERCQRREVRGEKSDERCQRREVR